MKPGQIAKQTSAPIWNLICATVSFAICFAAWGLISAFAPEFRSELGLTAQSTAFLVAVPVLLGSVARLPMGMLTDRFGGRLVFTGLFMLVAVAAAIVPLARDYNVLVAYAFFLGLAGSSFAIGVGLSHAGILRRSKAPHSACMASEIWDTPPRCSWDR
jgi:MFS transporter, NNP family, nitrate/nitrite transporter